MNEEITMFDGFGEASIFDSMVREVAYEFVKIADKLDSDYYWAVPMDSSSKENKNKMDIE